MDPASDSSVSLEQFAAITVALRSLGSTDAGRVLEQHGLSPGAWEKAKSYWKRQLEKDAEEGDGELLVRWAAAQSKAAQRKVQHGPNETPPAPSAPAPSGPMAPAPVLAAPMSVPRADDPASGVIARPSFLIKQSHKTLNSGPSPWAAPPAVSAPVSLPANSAPVNSAPAHVPLSAPAPVPLSAPPIPPPLVQPPMVPPASMAAPAGSHPRPVPFPHAAAPAWQEGETIMADDATPLFSALPFAEPTAKLPEPEIKRMQAVAQMPQVGRTLLSAPDIPLPEPPLVLPAQGPHGTADLNVDVHAMRRAMPFGGRAAPRPVAEPVEARPPSEREAPGSGAPFSALPAPSSQGESMSLSTYAALYAELNVYPQWASAIRARYGLAADGAFERLHETFKQRFQVDAALYARWLELYEGYRTHYVQRGRSSST